MIRDPPAIAAAVSPVTPHRVADAADRAVVLRADDDGAVAGWMIGDVPGLHDRQAVVACYEGIGAAALCGAVDAAIAPDPDVGARRVAGVAHDMHIGMHVAADIGVLVDAGEFLQCLVEIAAELAVARRAGDGQPIEARRPDSILVGGLAIDDLGRTFRKDGAAADNDLVRLIRVRRNREIVGRLILVRRGAEQQRRNVLYLARRLAVDPPQARALGQHVEDRGILLVHRDSDPSVAVPAAEIDLGIGPVHTTLRDPDIGVAEQGIVDQRHPEARRRAADGRRPNHVGAPFVVVSVEIEWSGGDADPIRILYESTLAPPETGGGGGDQRVSVGRILGDRIDAGAGKVLRLATPRIDLRLG